MTPTPYDPNDVLFGVHGPIFETRDEYSGDRGWVMVNLFGEVVEEVEC